jgi:hypothetical protein
MWRCADLCSHKGICTQKDRISEKSGPWTLSLGAIIGGTTGVVVPSRNNLGNDARPCGAKVAAPA